MRGTFNEFATDNISIVKKNGQKFEGFKASVQKGKVFLWDSSIFIEPKDLIMRHMSNGATETFEVVEPGFYEAVLGFEAHYQMTVRRMGEAEAERVVQSITYNFHGDNARVNNHNVDNSINTVSHGAQVSKVIEELRAELSKLGLSEVEEKEALEVVDELKTQLELPAPKKTIIRGLIAALPTAESITSIGASIIAMLGS